jgi:hypothetical protein
VAELIIDPESGTLRSYGDVPIIESLVAPRSGFLYVQSGAFIDSSSPALVMNPLDARALEVALETGKRMTDISVMFEALHRHMERLIENGARVALRRLDRNVRGYEQRADRRHHSTGPDYAPPTDISGT